MNYQVLTKEQIDHVIDTVKKHGQVTISNLCVIELKQAKEREFYNVASGKTEKTSPVKVSIKKARYLKDRLTK